MPTMQEAIKRLRWNKRQHVAVAIWCEDDVLERAKFKGINCDREEAAEILDEIDRKQDCELGITWDTIDCYLIELRDARQE
jgi:hypothetical protein